MIPIDGFAWANICRTCFVLECFETRRRIIATAFHLCLSVCFERVKVNQDSLKLNRPHQCPFHADGVYIFEASASCCVGSVTDCSKMQSSPAEFMAWEILGRQQIIGIYKV